MRLLFETKDDGRRFVNLAREENNPLCPASPGTILSRLITPRTNTNSPFMLLAQDDGVEADDILGPRLRVSSLRSHHCTN